MDESMHDFLQLRQVTHLKWRIHAVKSYEIKCSIEKLYGQDFVGTLKEKPYSVFLAEGSTVSVMKGSRLM